MIYRRRFKGSDVWHFMPTCSWWPRDQAISKHVDRRKRPTNGELCNQCKSKARKLLKRSFK